MVSVIIPTYNRAGTIKRAVKSILAQTYQDYEIIIVDDASTDNTEDIVNAIHDNRIRYIKLTKNGGACKARNVGIKNALGKYISFLDSDDEWNPKKLEKQLQCIQDSKATCVACNFTYVKGKKEFQKISPNHGSYFKKAEILDNNYITTGALLIEKKLLNEIGGFDESLPRYQDWDLVLRLLDCTEIKYLNESLLTVYYEANSITASTSKEKKYKALFRIYEKNIEAYEKNKKAWAHICWSLGLYSLFTDNPQYQFLKMGATVNGFNIKRYSVYIMTRMGIKVPIKLLYERNH